MNKQKTVLLVDDEPDFVDMIQMRLEANEYRVVVAYDGESGVKKAAAEQPDVILLDVMMPGMDGFKTLRELRHAETTRDIPVIMLTAKGETKSIFKAQEAGAADYLIKPVDSEKMLAMVKRHA
jgi:DNA-binding response OmpR family regulator